MTQGVSDRPWQADVRTSETKQFIRDIKRITRRKFIAEEKVRIVLEGFERYNKGPELVAARKEAGESWPGKGVEWGFELEWRVEFEEIKSWEQ
ncbi:hypothetical protein ACFLWY_01090 [Chloroflexota bacterium]